MEDRSLSVEAGRRFLAILATIAGDEPPSLTAICQACCELLSVSGASLALMTGGNHEGIACAFDSLALAVQDEEFVLGEGPGVDAHAQGHPIVVDDIRANGDRWPRFVQAVAQMGVRAVYALPLRVGAIRLGVLVLYRDAPGSLVGEELADCLVIVDLVSQLVLGLQAGATRESLAWAFDIADSRAVIHQATGMISAQLNVGVEEALVRLRGHAFAAECPTDVVAAQVVAGSLRFDELWR